MQVYSGLSLTRLIVFMAFSNTFFLVVLRLSFRNCMDNNSSVILKLSSILLVYITNWAVPWRSYLMLKIGILILKIGILIYRNGKSLKIPAQCQQLLLNIVCNCANALKNSSSWQWNSFDFRFGFRKQHWQVPSRSI